MRMLGLILSALLTLEHATTPDQLSWGLMGRHELVADHGMLFHFPDSRPRMVWMFNCSFDLDVAFLDTEYQIIEIYTLRAHPEWMDPARPVRSMSDLYPSTDPIVRRFLREAIISSQSVRYILEVPAGWFAQHHVEIGYRLTWTGSQGSLSQHTP